MDEYSESYDTHYDWYNYEYVNVTTSSDTVQNHTLPPPPYDWDKYNDVNRTVPSDIPNDGDVYEDMLKAIPSDTSNTWASYWDNFESSYVEVTIPSDTNILYGDQNVTIPTEMKNFVRQIGFHYSNGTS